MSDRIIKHGSTNVSVWLRAFSKVNAQPLTTIDFESAGIDLWYQRNQGQKVPITPVELNNPEDAHTDGGFIHIGNGYCRLDSPDVGFASGADSIIFGGETTDALLVGYSISLQPLTLMDIDTALSAILAAIAGITPTAFSVVLGSSIPSGTVQSSDLFVYATESKNWTWTITSSGVPVNLAGKAFKLVVQTPCGEDLFVIPNGDITLSGNDNNLVTVPTDGADNTPPGRYNYALWNTTDNQVLARGRYRILDAYTQDAP